MSFTAFFLRSRADGTPNETKRKPRSTGFGRNRKNATEGADTKQMNGYIISDVLTAMQAMHRRELEVYYQPKIDATTSRVKSAEALIRWVKEDGSVILPQQFLPAMV